MATEQRRDVLLRLLHAALSAVDAETLTRDALAEENLGSPTVVAIGKAAAGMCRGAASALGPISGVCVTDTPAEVPKGIELIVGDHPIPGRRSFEAGRRVVQVVAEADQPILALISGGGSALCEYPIPGIDAAFITEVNKVFLASGVSISETNLVRRHLSAIKNGGLSSVAPVPVATYAISDVCGADAGVIASGPTIFRPFDPDHAIRTLTRHGVSVEHDLAAAIRGNAARVSVNGPLEVIGDGQTAIGGLVSAATEHGLATSVVDDWIQGDIEEALCRFLEDAGQGLTVGAGEPDVAVTGSGAGGRNTQAALLAATHITGTDTLFAALATDGLDGNSSSAGAIVDGATLSRGGDPNHALTTADSATYLRGSGDLIEIGRTGTNVSDLWLIWRYGRH